MKEGRMVTSIGTTNWIVNITNGYTDGVFNIQIDHRFAYIHAQLQNINQDDLDELVEVLRKL